MNNTFVSGKVIGDPVEEIRDNCRITKFRIKNTVLINNKASMCTIRCIAYGNLATYCNNELYNEADVLVTGRICNRVYVNEQGTFNMFYIHCNTVSKLEQKEYD